MRKALCGLRASVGTARGGFTRTDAQSFAGREKSAPAAPEWRVNAEAAQSSTNGAREAGARAEFVFQTAKHNAAVVAAENDRLGAMKFGPTAQIGHLVFAQHGERATEGLGSLHVRFFTGGMMLKWRDVLSMPSDSMSNAHAADCSPRTYRRTRVWGWGMFNGAEVAKTFMPSAGLLPFMGTRRLRAETKEWDSGLEKARDLIVRNSPACQGSVLLVRKREMPHCVAREIASFCEDD